MAGWRVTRSPGLVTQTWPLQGLFQRVGTPLQLRNGPGLQFTCGSKVDPDRFLRDVNLSIRALVDLVADLDGACNQYGIDSNTKSLVESWRPCG